MSLIPALVQELLKIFCGGLKGPPGGTELRAFIGVETAALRLRLHHAIYQLRFYSKEGGRPEPPAISKTVTLMKVKFFRILETPLNILEMLKLFT